jgi:hypothetical protein
MWGLRRAPFCALSRASREGREPAREFCARLWARHDYGHGTTIGLATWSRVAPPGARRPPCRAHPGGGGRRRALAVLGYRCAAGAWPQVCRRCLATGLPQVPGHRCAAGAWSQVRQARRRCSARLRRFARLWRLRRFLLLSAGGGLLPPGPRINVETFRPVERKHAVCVFSFRAMRSFHVVRSFHVMQGSHAARNFRSVRSLRREGFPGCAEFRGVSPLRRPRFLRRTESPRRPLSAAY